MIVFGIETSCDETSASVVEDGKIVLSNVTASSLRLHKKYKGIIPEIASRAHIECISSVASQALVEANISGQDIDLVSVTKGPGLIGSLLTGISFAKALSFSLKKPLIGVNHLQAHLYASFLSLKNKDRNYAFSNLPNMPFVGLVVSGGHTSLFFVDKKFNFRLLGSTVDDAAGEAFDKVAKIVDVGYPGGPIIEQLAKRGDSSKIRFSCFGPGNANFSFSGIKTAVLYKFKACGLKLKVPDVAAGFQRAVVDVLMEKSFLACQANNVNTFIVGGGVAANSYLRDCFLEEGKRRNIKVFFPKAGLSLDNAAMIAGLAYQLFKKGKRSSYFLTAEVN